MCSNCCRVLLCACSCREYRDAHVGHVLHCCSCVAICCNSFVIARERAKNSSIPPPFGLHSAHGCSVLSVNCVFLGCGCTVYCRESHVCVCCCAAVGKYRGLRGGCLCFLWKPKPAACFCAFLWSLSICWSALVIGSLDWNVPCLEP
jgi:hypothetical protein